MADNETSYLPIGTCLEQIEKAVYGREVRKAIHDGIAQCYDDTVEGVNAAQQAASDTQEVIDDMTAATTRANNAAAAAENVNAAASKVQDGPYQITVTNSQGTSATIEIPDPAAEVKKKANLEAVTVKKTVGPAETVTFEDGVDAPAVLTKIKLEPKQDLHGYDHPWVGGAGKNLLKPEWFPERLSGGLTSTWMDDGSIRLTGTATVNARLSSSEPNILLPSGTYIITIDGISPVSGNHTNTIRVRTSSASPAIDTDGVFTVDGNTAVYLAVPVTNGGDYSSGFDIKIMLAAYSDGDEVPEWEPYSNICPIEGYEEVEVVRTGKNMLHGWTQINATSKTELIRADFVNDNTYTIDIGSDYRNCKGMVYYYNEYKEYVGRSAGSNTWPFALRPTTSISSYASGTLRENNIKYIQVVIYTGLPSPVTISVLDGLNVQVKCNDTSTDYVDPDYNEISINLASPAGSTVYGGELTLNEDGSGTVVVDKAGFTFDGSTTPFAAMTDGVFTAYASASRPQIPADTSRILEETQCNWYTLLGNGFKSSVSKVSELEGYDGVVLYAISNGGTYVNFYIRDPRFSTVEEFNAHLQEMATAEKTLTIVYPMLNKQTYSLTATQVQTLVGTNHVWTDAGEITLTYRSDKYAELERRISQLEALVLES